MLKARYGKGELWEEEDDDCDPKEMMKARLAKKMK